MATFRVSVRNWANATTAEDRWNRGRFGKEYEESVGAAERKNWDRKLGLGHQKLFDVRRTYMDWFFLDEFLTRELIEKLKLYIYVEAEREEVYETVVAETDWRASRGCWSRP